MKAAAKSGGKRRSAPAAPASPNSAQNKEGTEKHAARALESEHAKAVQALAMESPEEQVEELEARRDEIVTILDDRGVGVKPKPAKHADEKRETHREFLLKEMAWLANDFQEERKRHLTRGKKLSKAILQHNKQLENKDVKEAKEQELQLKRISARMSRDVKKFWLRINQVITFKQKLDADEARQKAMDKHLGYLVKQTERYTSLLAEQMRAGDQIDEEEGSDSDSDRATAEESEDSGVDSEEGSGQDEQSTGADDINAVHSSSSQLEQAMDAGDDEEESVGNSALHQNTDPSAPPSPSPRRPKRTREERDAVDATRATSRGETLELDSEASADADDEEFENESEADDETTLIQAEAEHNESYQDELAALQAEGEMSVEQLRQMYGGVFGQPEEAEAVPEEATDDSVLESGDEDFEVAKSEEDDETTMIEAERMAEGSYADELAALQEDGDIPVEELRRMYGNVFGQVSENGDDDVDAEVEDSDSGELGVAAHFSHTDADISSGDDKDDGEFSAASEADDETTFIQAENEQVEGYDEELAALKNEGELSVEQLRHMYAGVFGHASDSEEGGDEPAVDESQSSDLSESGIDEEFEAESEQDDETTLIQAEHEEAGEDYASEIRQLEEDGELSVEELRRRYANLEHADESENGDELAMQIDEGHSMQNGETQVAQEGMDEDADEEGEDEDEDEDVETALTRLQAADDVARSIRVDRPYFLTPKLRLREYQHVGLNWLVSLHERRLNGILADEMGLGKTLQTISLLAYLACYKGIWGPHLIVVPTSVLVNWEVELKKWCPIFKVLTYYGSAKHRKTLRQGWSKLNTFHICITSYQLVVQDAVIFRRKRWYYMVLDEAHNIKNFKSQRWQTLLNFNTHRRLLLTGTPLQNNLMELWSLMHFLMPHLFRSRKEFSYWFSNPLTHMVEGNRGMNSDIISRLHTIMRPFILRRLKKDVEKQLPGKYEHIVRCSLSKRQLLLYEEFMSRTTTRSALAGANFMGMMNILMQLRKVCNHPDLFEPRPIVSPFQLFPPIVYEPSSLATTAWKRSPFDRLSPHLLYFGGLDTDSYAQGRVRELQTPRPQLIVVDDMSVQSPTSVSNPVLLEAIAHMRQRLWDQKHARRVFNAALSESRCNQEYLSISWRLVRALTMPKGAVQAAQQWHVDARDGIDVSVNLRSMLVTLEQRVVQMEPVVEQYVFVIPRVISPGIQLAVSRPDRSSARAYEQASEALIPVVKRALTPFYRARIRQSMFFPDRKLVQFDSGKLQTLNVLLRRLKKEGHKCLIFTQMSRMLDILEVFLNLHGHTYVRLDGSTGVEKRQKLMDRFNSDPKLFCFILSTRSGGLGINLTGADTVIFYDSDWNPSMDAQAQDRAHRIGQTRDVHIYRLVCASTVEENILIKAKQKRHLDFLVMTEGNFTAESFYDQHSLQELLNTGIAPISNQDMQQQQQPSSTEQSRTSKAPQHDTEAIMLALEDDDDIAALRGARKEAVEEMQEFDENAPIPTDDAAESSGAAAPSNAEEQKAVNDETVNEQEVEEEFNAWQSSVGPDFKALEANLRPFERYAVKFRTAIDPYYSLFFLTDQQKRAELEMAEAGTEWDVQEIEREKEQEEARAFEEGELLATKVSKAAVEKQKHLYLKLRSQANAAKQRRRLTGDAWAMFHDSLTGIPFWYNEDTGEAQYGKPKVIVEKERYQAALERGYTRIPVDLLQRVYDFLLPYPERTACMAACARWHEAGTDEDRFFKRVLPVESGAREKLGGVRLGKNDYVSVEAAVAAALAGDTIMLDPGHHWESSLSFSKPLRVVGDATEPSRVVIELSDTISVLPGAKVEFCGVTIRRPRKMHDKGPAIIAHSSTVQLCGCVVNNDGATGAGVYVAGGSLQLFGSVVTCGYRSGISVVGGSLLVAQSSITENKGSGVTILDSVAGFEDVYLTKNQQHGIAAYGSSVVWLEHCDVTNNKAAAGNFDMDATVAVFHDRSVFEAQEKPLVESFAPLHSGSHHSESLVNLVAGTETAMHIPNSSAMVAAASTPKTKRLLESTGEGMAAVSSNTLPPIKTELVVPNDPVIQETKRPRLPVDAKVEVPAIAQLQQLHQPQQPQQFMAPLPPAAMAVHRPVPAHGISQQPLLTANATQQLGSHAFAQPVTVATHNIVTAPATATAAPAVDGNGVAASARTIPFEHMSNVRYPQQQHPQHAQPMQFLPTVPHPAPHRHHTLPNMAASYATMPEVPVLHPASAAALPQAQRQDLPSSLPPQLQARLQAQIQAQMQAQLQAQLQAQQYAALRARLAAAGINPSHAALNAILAQSVQLPPMFADAQHLQPRAQQNASGGSSNSRPPSGNLHGAPGGGQPPQKR